MKDLPPIESIQQLLDPKYATIRQLGTVGTQEFTNQDEIELLKVVVRDPGGGATEQDFARYGLSPAGRLPSDFKSPFRGGPVNGR